MGAIGNLQPVLLLAGLIANPAEGFARARAELEKAFGKIEVESPVWPFNFTDYYAREMGDGLLRQFVAFADLRELEGMYRTKIESNKIEVRLAAAPSAGVARPVNIDPGYICNSKLVLFSTKDFSHRLYAGDGIFAESTLEWRGNEFIAHPWTFPDYRTAEYRGFFHGLREVYRAKLRPGAPCQKRSS